MPLLFLNKYKRSLFIEMSAIGSGGFGTVFKVKHRLDDKIYAVKRIQFGEFSEEKKQKVIKEVKSLAKLDSDFVVKYYNSWLESNHLFIQMEYCSQSLRSLLENKPLVFERQPEDPMNVFEYFISCEIFKELLESVQFLHESNPPVIHRDLKPDNILIDRNFISNRFVKLCDFGLATDHNTDIQTTIRYQHSSGVGTINLSLIGELIFDINLQATSILYLYQTLVSMMSTPNWRQRPECRQVLAKYNKWSIHKTVVTNHRNVNNF
ncbi:unnamed protein product [Medioppia subpectinata]|uniref:Protein kinase domain-containing protein n=1 Tax=Medioppia subpectinata TaxID=1979941 RepID=A0A7R9PWD5_9ACAR|nr:unnamed protein product [Medioppia subpectinata]CAG2103831.1 unnamed protein product [Medioppia subpectinata]